MAKAHYLDLAAGRLFNVESRQELPDIINFRDISSSWKDGYRREMLGHISRVACGPNRVEIIEHPKDPISVRPLARFDIKDRLTYETIVAQIAYTTDGLLSDNVFSYRTHRSQIHSVEDWLEWRDQARKILESDSLLTMARTDVASFYEHIDIDILKLDLARAGVDDLLLSQLYNFLQRFQQQSHAWGLPQGSSASGALSNVYLLPYDEYIRQSGVQHVRYSDDTYIFGYNWEQLRSVLAGANQALRARRLTIASKKTEILDRSASLDHLDDSFHDQVSYFYYRGSLHAKKLLRELFTKATEQGSAGERDVKFSLTRFRRKRDATAVQWALSNLKDLHHISDQILRYMENIPKHREDMISTLESTVLDFNLTDYSYLERNILHSALRKQIKSKVLKDYAWAILRDRNRPNYPREFAARYIGRFSEMADGPLLRMQYETEGSEPVQRAILVALYECHYIPPFLLEGLSESTSDLRWTARYLLREPPVIPLPK
ncbi:reverse transcriptase domain-containing protein [Streptomyces sp. NPDC059402]|uniref:RNA-directed DNA polymerase n=1 Tax=Streptomyces sp. NPDC059402 TaxID=3346822 RepID=UPI0036819100